MTNVRIMLACNSGLWRGVDLDFDVIIAGAGPAGSTTARFCGKKGLKTLLVERDRFPRYKPCGGCLSPRVLREVDFDIGGVIENATSEAKFTFRLEDPFSMVCQDPIGYLVTRASFDHLLWRKALEGGADLSEGRRVVGFRQDPEGVDVSIEGGKVLRCRYLVGADGARSTVARSLLGGVTKKAGMAFETETRMAPGMGEGWPFVHLDFGSVPHGYGWIFPKGNLVSMGICALFPSKGMKLRSRFDRFAGCVDYIRGGRVERARFHPLPTFFGDTMSPSGGRVLLVGDAANLINPMTGEGIYYAIRSGKMAGEAVVKAITEGHKGIGWYQEALRRTLFQDLEVALTLAKVVYQFPKVAYTVLKSSEDLRFLYRDIWAGNARYELFSRKMADGLRRTLGGKIPAMVTMSSPVD